MMKNLLIALGLTLITACGANNLSTGTSSAPNDLTSLANSELQVCRDRLNLFEEEVL